MLDDLVPLNGSPLTVRVGAGDVSLPFRLYRGTHDLPGAVLTDNL